MSKKGDEFDSDFEQLFGEVTFDSNSDDKIVIRDLEPRRKVRRRVKKGTKQEVLEKRQNLQADRKITIVKSDSMESGLGENHQIDRQYKKPVKSSKNNLKSGKIKKLEKNTNETDPSSFRNNSKKWQDYEYSEYKEAVKKDPEPGLLATIKNASVFQWVACILAVTLFVSAIMGTSVYAKSNAAENRAQAMERLASFEMAESNEIAQLVESVEAPLSFDQAVYEEHKVLSLVLSSVEKDLKIKLVDEDDTLVRGIAWSVTVSDSEGNEFEQADDDQDGIIHLTDVNAGDYSVVLNATDQLEGYEFPTERQMVSVKAKVEYKVIQDIKEEIKTEREVNAAVEDANGNQAADVETGPVITDTVEWCESTKTANGEEYVEATPDISKTASIIKENKFLAVINNLKKSARVPLLKNGVLGARLMYLAENEPGDSSSSSSSSTEHSHNFVGGVCECGVADPSYNPPAGGETSSSTEHVHSFVGGLCSCGAADPNYNPPGDTSSSATTSSSSTTTSSSSTSTSSSSTSTSCSSSAHVHSYTNGKCSCGAVDPAHTHTLTCTSNNDGSHKAVCACGYTLTENCSLSSGKCSLCGYEEKAKYSDDAQLYDASKNALYVYDNGSYRLAKYRDRNSFTKFYRKTESYQYTGWQTIDGKRYYYRSDHTYVTGEQIIGGVKYTFASDGSLNTGSGTLGIDVSKYQPSINWESVKASGVNFVIIRCGYRGSSTGVLIEDPYFRSHIKGAKAAGLKVGVYFFTTAVTEAEAVEEASMCAYLCKGYGLDYPIFMDCESSNRPGYNGMSASQRTAIIKAFCNTIRSAGYSAGVYANKTWLTSYMNAGELSGYKIWLAQYNSAGPTYSGRYDMWQYTSKGSVQGISGNVDMNQSYMGY